jgi:hypothetical protein
MESRSVPVSPELLELTDRLLCLCTLEELVLLVVLEDESESSFCSNLEEMRLLRLPGAEKVFDNFSSSHILGDGGFVRMRRD